MRADQGPVKVLTFYDEKGWAWWHRAHHVRANLSPAVEMSILRNGQPFDPSAYDLILLFEHYLLNLMPQAPRGKVILGSSCPKLTHEMIARLKADGCLAGMVNNLESHRRFAGEARLFCCQNGVDADLFSPAGPPPAAPTACWVGNSKSIGNKGLDLIREACLRAGVPLLVLDKAELGGEGSALTQEQVRDRIYRRATFYVNMSEFEGTPNPMLEALACGLPAISTRVGNAPEILRDGHNGILVERTVESLEAAIRRLIALDAAALSRNARRSILDGWTWKHRAAAYESMFLELARGSLPTTAQAPVAAAQPAAPAKRKSFTGMVEVPFLAPKIEEQKLYLADLKSKAESLKANPNDFDSVLGAALDAIRLGDYGLARDFTAAAAAMTRYYNEVIRDMSLHIRARERKQGRPPAADPAAALGRGTIRVAMLTYNALDYTRQCLHGLLTRTRRPLEIHIRENASSDDTVRWLRELNHPRVHVEFGQENRGVPGGRNRLIEMIRPVAHPDDFVVFLDNDIEILEGWEDHFLEFFGSHPQVGIASSLGQRMIVEANGRSLREPPYADPEPVDVALGGYACWMRAGAMLEVGGYDENLGLFWHEDDDFCVRALGKGIDVWAVPGAPLIHHGHKSGVALTGLAQGGSPKNLAYLADKWRRLGLVLPNGEIDRSAVRARADGPAAAAVPPANPPARPEAIPPAPVPSASRPLPAGGGERPGINIFGRFGAPSGSRAGKIARLLMESGHPVSLVQQGGPRPLGGDADLAPLFRADAGGTAYPIDLFLLEADSAAPDPAKRREPGREPFAVAWLPTGSRLRNEWIPFLAGADLVLTGSRGSLEEISARLPAATARYAAPLGGLSRSEARDASPRPSRARWGLSDNALVFGTTLDAAEDHRAQNPAELIQAFAQAFGKSADAALCVYVENAAADPRFVERLRDATRELPNVRYIVDTLPAGDAAELISAWDVVASFHRAGPPSAALLSGMALGKPVLAMGHTGNLDILHEGNAMFVRHARDLPGDAGGNGSGLPAAGMARPDIEDAARAMRRLAGSAALRMELGGAGRAAIGALEASWGVTAVFRRVEAAWRERQGRAAEGPGWIPGPRGPQGEAAGLRILFQNRVSAEVAPGGDTMVMDRYREGLRALGATVDVRYDAAADYRSYDLAHLYNLVLPDAVEPQARAARAAGVPFVVQALQEDQAAYEGRAWGQTLSLAQYVKDGQPRDMLPRLLELARKAKTLPTKTSPFAAGNAAALLCNSEAEAGYVRSLHPGAPCVVNPYGVDAFRPDIGPEAFEKAFAAKDFLLCVGRLESRKNQLSLLAALEDEDVTLVLADGGVCYMPEYAEACRGFRRRGRTVFTGRMSREMLLSCFRAAKAHILPSWQELPGLVTLEAALAGCTVAATPHGGIREYMGGSCRYFEPDDLPGMRAAALSAMAAPRNGEAAAMAKGFTWERSVAGVLKAYRAVLGAPDSGARAPAGAGARTSTGT